MLWNKFQDFVTSHLDLAPCLSEQLQVPWLRGPKQSVVERNLDYVCVRPWQSLKINSLNHFVTHETFETNISHIVYAHIEGEEHPCSRARSCDSDSSVATVIEELREWHKIYWAKQPDRPLVFDAVIRRCNLVHYTKDEWNLDKFSLSFYLFPAGFNA